MASSIGRSYESENESVLHFFENSCFRAQDRAEAVGRASEKGISPELFSAIEQYNETLPKSAARDQNLQALSNGAPVVLTGQQVGLFVSPLFTLYKIVTAIASAQALTSETGIHNVPVFWVQSEDHDFDEIRSTHLLSHQQSLVTIELPSRDDTRQKISVGRQTLPPEISVCIEDAKKLLPEGESRDTLISLLERHYRQGASLADAFSGMLAEIFSEEGLILFDPLFPTIPQHASHVYKLALEKFEQIEETLRTRSEELARAGFDSQVHVRELSPLFFYHPQGPDGARYRLTKEKDDWSFVGGTGVVSSAELHSSLDKHPERFSSSALLRQIIQDSLFPTAAYIGGRAELSYVAQLRLLYPLFDLAPPLIIPRQRFVVVDQKASKGLSSLKLTAADLEIGGKQLDEKLISQTITKERSPEQLEQNALALVDKALNEFRAVFENTDKTLLGSLDKAEQRMKNQIDSLKNKYSRSLLSQQELGGQRLTKLKALISPLDKPQERVLGAAYLLGHYGAKVKAALFAQVSPFEPNQSDAAKEIRL